MALPSRCSTWNYPKRFQDNGNKTDGFQDLLFKAYLISREMLYLSFFKRIPQHEIGRRYGRSRSTAGYHIRKSIQQLFEEMEGLAHEE